MAISIISQVWAYPHLRDHAQLLVMLALADFSDEKGQSFPSVSTLADRARVSERHVRKILEHLRRHDLIAVEEGAGVGKITGQRSNLYTINLSKLMSREPIPPPSYGKENKHTPLSPCHPCHNARGTPGTMPPVPLSQEAEKGGGTPVTAIPPFLPLSHSPPLTPQEPSEENHHKEASERTRTRARGGISREIPTGINTPQVREWLQAFDEHLEERIAQGFAKPMTSRQISTVLRQLEREGEFIAVEVIKLAIQKGWSTLVFNARELDPIREKYKASENGSHQKKINFKAHRGY